MISRDCCLNDYIALYNSGASVFDLIPEKMANNKEYIAYLTKTKGNPVKFISYKTSFSLIPYDLGMFSFYETNKLFWMLPLELPDGSIKGFIIRGFKEKVYRTVTFSQFSLPYGYLDLVDFAKEKHFLLLTEGTRDAMYIKSRVTPYCLSVNMAKIGVDILHIITKIADKFLLLMDMDEAGRKVAKINQELLIHEGKQVYLPEYELKDVGDYFYASTKQQYVFHNKLKVFINV